MAVVTLDEEVERVKPLLGPEVVRLTYRTGLDHSDEPSLYFNIVLTDAASRPEVLGEVSSRIRWTLYDELKPYENWDRRLYTSVRSQSEWDQIGDNTW